jgi:hypothetical protein
MGGRLDRHSTFLLPQELVDTWEIPKWRTCCLLLLSSVRVYSGRDSTAIRERESQVMDFTEISEKEWASLPSSSPAKGPRPWDAVLDRLESGKIVQLEVAGDKQLRGTRIGLARSATFRGMKLEFRVSGNTLAVRKSDKPVKARVPKEKP